MSLIKRQSRTGFKLLIQLSLIAGIGRLVRRDRSKKLQNVTAVTEASSWFWQGFL